MTAHSVRVYCCINTESHLRCCTGHDTRTWSNASWHMAFILMNHMQKLLVSYPEMRTKCFLTTRGSMNIQISRSTAEGAFQVLLKTQLNLHLLHIRVAFFSFTDVEMWAVMRSVLKNKTQCVSDAKWTQQTLSVCVFPETCGQLLEVYGKI